MYSVYTSWVPSVQFTSTSQMYELITVPVTMMLAKLASYAVFFEQTNVYATPKATFDELTSEFNMYSKKIVLGTVPANGNQAISRTPQFSFPTF